MDLFTGALGLLPSKLLELLKDEYKLQKGVKYQLQSLSQELESMQAALRNNVAAVPWDQLNKVVKIWAQEVREASYDIEDILDTFLVRVDGDVGADLSRLERAMKKMGYLFSKAKARHEISYAIEGITKKLQNMSQRHAWYKIDDLVAKPAATTSIDPRLLALYTKVSHLVGIAEPRDKVAKMLTLVGEDKETKIVSIVGFGGLGKTTLAKAVYEKLTDDVQFKAFVPIGQNPDLKKVLKDILICLDKSHYLTSLDSLDESQLIQEIRGFLKDKRYFIVIDDIWDVPSWSKIRLAMYDNRLGSKIVITTRNHDAAMNAGCCYNMETLPYESSKELFYGRVFGSEQQCPNEFLEISEEIIKKCGGVPLAITTTSSLLSNKLGSTKVWHEFCESIGSGLGSNSDMENMRKILSLSYYDLPAHLKACLLYLCGFPENFVIKKDNLIRKWIAEGFIPKSKGMRLFEIGEGYFDDLINRSIIQAVMIKGTGHVYGCRVGCMVYDLIRFLLREENFVCVRGKEVQISISHGYRIRWLALQNINQEQSLGDNMKLFKLRSLTAIGCPMYMIPPVFRFILLRVLDLESCGSMEGYDHEHIGKLLHLRFLGLRNTLIRKLPESIGGLKFLQTLELEGSGVEELPASMGGLAGLMCLNVDWTTRVPDWIGMLTSLEQLVMYPGGGNDEHSVTCFVNGLGNMTELRELRALIKADDEKQLRDLLQSLSNLPKIEVIHIDFYGVQWERGVQFEPIGFALSKNLRFLELLSYEFPRLPSWINAKDLSMLCHLSLLLLDVHEHDLENLGRFPQLRHLHLQILNTERREAITCGSGAFVKLKFCSITKPFRFLEGAMPNLEVLDFHFSVRLLCDANNILNFDFGLENLPSLQQVIVQINCLYSLPKEVDQAEEALRNAINMHPNSPILDISLYGRRMKKTLVGDPKPLSHPKLEKTDNYGVNKISNSDKGKGVVVAQGASKSAYYSKSLSLALDGIDEPMDELIKRLYVVNHNAANNKKMKILSIVRSEGLGKTTLAQKVFDKLSPKFDRAAFVLVGQNPDMRKVFSDILISLDKENYEDFPVAVLDIMDLIGLVRKSLINNRFFVVVDDIWDLKAWDIIKCALIENNNGSAVLKTASRQNWDRLKWTASEEDKSHFNAGMQSGLLRSSTDFIKEFFYKKLFESEDECPLYLKDICEKLIEICDGLLSVVDETVELLGSVPRTLKDWQAVYDRRKLALSSYPSLPVCNKKCLQYFCMFPQGYEISAERLVWAWIAQGFVQETEGEKDLKKVGMGYLRDLIKGKMIEAVEVDADGMALSCRVYDLVHDFIISKSIEENFIAILDNQKSKDRAVLATVHGLSIQGNDSQPKPWFSKVKSLVAACDNLPPVSGFGDLLVMDLGGCDSLQVGHLEGISKTTSLGYLAIGGKCIAAIPREIAKLKHLRTLDLSASGLSELPQCVLLLSELERLFVNIHMKIPDGISKMSALQELGDINIVKPKLLEKLCKLSQLRVLRIALWSWDEGKSSVKVWWDTLHSLLGSCKNIETLCILTFCSLDFMDGPGDKWPLQTLKNLAIRHSAFHHELPRWFDSLSNVSSLTIEVNKLSKNITNTLGKLSALCSLSLTSKEVPVPEVYFVINSDTFKKLESLKFVCNAMVGVFAPQSNCKQQLRRLTIVFHASRTKHINKDFRFGLDNLLSLEHVRVEINCFSASHQMVNDAEDAIRKELSRAGSGSGSSQPNLEIRRLEKESMIAEEDQTTGYQVAGTSYLKTEGNGDESDSMDLFESTTKSIQAKPFDVGPAPMSSVDVVSKVLYRNSSSNTFLKNVGILMSSMKIEKSTELLSQEHAAEKQGSTTLLVEVDALKKSDVTEQALANTQRELVNTQREVEEFKKQMEENNLLLKRILQLNNAGIS